MKYFAVVHKDKDSAFGVSFPDLPGCFGAGDSRDEAIETAKVSLREYAQSIEELGQTLPAPKSLDEIMADPAMAEVTAGGEFFIEVPLITAGIRRRVNISIDDRLLDAIDEASKLAGLNRSAFLAEVTTDWLKRNTGAVSTSESGPMNGQILPERKRA